jgi:hypothetical protein
MLTLCFSSQTWIETTQEDFADGTFERNLYASQLNNGTLQYAPTFDLNSDGKIELFCTDRLGNTVRLYWSSENGYSANNVTLFPSSGGGNCDAADLNNDGYPDFVVNHYFDKISIYWGTPNGISPNFYFEIPMIAYNRQGVFIADFNKDGYLDMATSQEQVTGYATVFWGSSEGFNVSDRTDLPVYFSVHNIESADLNKDGWLDIIYVEYYGTGNGYVKIFWGSHNGFSGSNYTSLVGPYGNHGLSIADLNDDAYIDIITTGWYGSPSYIYWGSSQGYSYTYYQTLTPGPCYGGSSIADLNNDGYLDIVYHRGGYGVAYQRIYWGSASGYSDGNSDGFGYAIEASGGLIADLNDDGILDIFTNTRTPTNISYLFWGPDFTTAITLPSSQDHHGHFREIGNIYNREYYDDYISSVHDAYKTADWNIIEWDATIPDGASVQFWVRSSSDTESQKGWSTWYPVTNGGEIPDCLNARYLQYKIHLTYTNPCYLPSVDEVRITYDVTTTIPADVVIKPETINLNSNGKFTAFVVVQGYEPTAIDPATVVCEGAPALYDVGTANKFIAKFNVQDLMGVTPGEEVVLTVTGQLNDGNSFSGTDTVRVIRLSLAFQDNLPNPIGKHSMITFTSTKSSMVKAVLYDISGRKVKDFGMIQCHNEVGVIKWDGKNTYGHTIPAGIYFLSISTETERTSTKIIIFD